MLLKERLFRAAKLGNVERVRELGRMGADVTERDGDGRTAMHFAAMNEHVEVSLWEALVALGADMEAPAFLGVRPMHMAAARGHTEVVRALVAMGADKEAQADAGVRPLHLALSRAALRRRGWGHTASVCTCAMYLASSYAPQARGGQAVSSAVTAQSCLALRGRLPTDGLGPPKTQVCVAREARAARAKQPKCGCLTRADGACRPRSRAAGASGRLGPPRGTGALTATSSRRAWPPAP